MQLAVLRPTPGREVSCSNVLGIWELYFSMMIALNAIMCLALVL